MTTYLLKWGNWKAAAEKLERPSTPPPPARTKQVSIVDMSPGQNAASTGGTAGARTSFRTGSNWDSQADGTSFTSNRQPHFLASADSYSYQAGPAVRPDHSGAKPDGLNLNRPTLF
eukprot:scaffold550245_cov45-Prasinocladus_malaysianus.AAC.1